MRLCDLLVEILCQCSDERTRKIAESMKVALKSPAIAAVFDICIENSIGCKGQISVDVLSQAEKGFNDYNDLMLEKSNLDALHKQLEKFAYRHFCYNVFVALKCRLAATGQLKQ